MAIEAWISYPYLSTSPPMRPWAQGDLRTIPFDAEEAITDADATLFTYANGYPVAEVTGAVLNVDPGVTGVDVTIGGDGIVRGTTYILIVEFTTAAGEIWHRAMILDCVR